MRSKLGLLGLCAVVFGVMAMSASSAQAALSWLVLDSTGTTATNLEAVLVGEKDTAHLTLLTKIVGLKISITCTNFELNGVSIKPVDTLSNGKVKFTGCVVYNGWVTLGEAIPGCEVSTKEAPIGTIETNKGKGLLELHSNGEVLTKIEPEVAGPFVTILIKNCSLPEENPVNGVLFLKDCESKATIHELKHLVEQGPLTSLWIGKDTAEHLETSLDGSGWIKLGGAHTGLKWAAMDA